MHNRQRSITILGSITLDAGMKVTTGYVQPSSTSQMATRDASDVHAHFSPDILSLAASGGVEEPGH